MNPTDLLMLLASAQGLFLGILILHKYGRLRANRFRWDEAQKLKIRLDIGWGNCDSGFYLTLGEAF